jgi:hypothetical protein
MEYDPLSRSLHKGDGLLESSSHLRVVLLVELIELLRVLKFDVETQPPWARGLPFTVRALGLFCFLVVFRASVAGHNDFPVFGVFPGLVFAILREFCFVCVSCFNCFLKVFWLFL